MRLGRLGFDPLARPAPIHMVSRAQPVFLTKPVDATHAGVLKLRKGKNSGKR